MKKIVVLAKQVPDTANITGNAMKEDGTVNRAILPTVFNPEDLNALETALEIKDLTGALVIVLSMGPAKAVDVIRHALFMGADQGYLITDRKFAGADTLATSYILAEAIKKIGGVDLVLAGRQAIDGDTAQVGPQVAEKLGYNQVSYVTKFEKIDGEHIVVERDGEFQTEVIKAKLPLLMTITATANEPRYPSARSMLRFFKADIAANIPAEKVADYQKNGWLIPVLTLEDLKLDETNCGLKGSPTKVHAIKSIVLQGGDLKMYNPQFDGIKQLVRDIMKDYVEVNS